MDFDGDYKFIFDNKVKEKLESLKENNLNNYVYLVVWLDTFSWDESFSYFGTEHTLESICEYRNNQSMQRVEQIYKISTGENIDKKSFEHLILEKKGTCVNIVKKSI